MSLIAPGAGGCWRLVCALVGKLQQTRDFKAFSAAQLRIDTGHQHLRVAVDGELRRLDAPLHYKISPGALRVIVPGTQPGNVA